MGVIVQKLLILTLLFTWLGGCTTSQVSFRENAVRKQVSVLHGGESYVQNDFKAEKIKKSIVDHKESVKKDDGNLKTRMNLANLHFVNGEVDEAEKQTKAVLKINPTYVDAIRLMAKIMYQKGQYKLVRLICENSFFKGVIDSELHNVLAKSYLKLNMKGLAFHHLKKAITVDQRNMAAQMNLGSFYLHYKDYNRAGIQFQKVLLVAPASVHAKAGLATVLYRKGEYDRSLKLFNEVLKVNPNHKLALFNAGLVLKENNFAQKNLKQSLKHFERLLDLVADDRKTYELAYNKIVEVRDSMQNTVKSDQEIWKLAENGTPATKEEDVAAKKPIKKKSEPEKTEEEAYIEKGLGLEASVAPVKEEKKEYSQAVVSTSNDSADRLEEILLSE